MCGYKTLAHSKDGYIILCENCNNFQLAFGTTAVNFDAKDFTNFTNQVQTFFEINSHNGFPKQKTIQLDLYCTHSMLILNYNELAKLAELLNEAEFTLEMNIMLLENNIAQ